MKKAKKGIHNRRIGRGHSGDSDTRSRADTDVYLDSEQGKGFQRQPTRAQPQHRADYGRGGREQGGEHVAGDRNCGGLRL